MKKETTKEIGKLFFDLTKIIFAIAILTPLLKEGTLEILTIIPATLTALLGIYFINKGAKNE